MKRERTKEVMILGAPYVFARNKLRKPKHTEVVKMIVRPVLCQNDCGMYYVAKDEQSMQPGDVCPTCNTPPKKHQIGEPDEIEVSVHMAFGNLVDVKFLRSLGAVSRRSLVLQMTPNEPQKSTALVLPTKL